MGTTNELKELRCSRSLVENNRGLGDRSIPERQIGGYQRASAMPSQIKSQFGAREKESNRTGFRAALTLLATWAAPSVKLAAVVAIYA